jgi:SSS family solute:Na+ symporter
MADFLGQVLIHDQTGLIASAAVIGLFAAAMSTSDSQLFALGNELRGLISKKESDSLTPVRLAIISFALAALVFSLLSSDELVLLARVSFAGTAMMGPLIILGIFSRKPMGIMMIVASGMALLTFILSQASLIPAMVGPLRMDLFLMILLTCLALVNFLLRK